MRAAQVDHGHQPVPSELALRVEALESLLVEKGLVDPAALDALIDTYEHKVLGLAPVWYRSGPLPPLPRGDRSARPATLRRFSCMR